MRLGLDTYVIIDQYATYERNIMSEEQDLDEVQSKHCSYEKDGVWYIGESTAIAEDQRLIDLIKQMPIIPKTGN
jgi:hypothetical protein